MKWLWPLITGIGLTALLGGAHATAVAEKDARVDAVFSAWTSTTPGCAIGVRENGRDVLARGYGMADLEHGVRITPDSIFEAGSVSKQFTAAAVLLLAREGKLSIDDPVRKYVAELPEYSKPLLIRHMLNHTGGLRDWGSVESIAGWPRTSRVYTHAHVLDIVSRQRALNFDPGTNWSYSNTGFNLAAIIVSRVSGMPFPDFTRERLFKPIGLAHTSWRDDYTRIVKGRALGYEKRENAYYTDMPFENVYGNAALLTTVGDLLKWNENFDNPIVGDRAFVDELQRPGKFSDGRPHLYGFGLYSRMYRGVREIGHSGSTAGYRAFLARYPDQHLSLALLCNAAGVDPTQVARQVAEIYLGNRMKPAIDSRPTKEQLAAAAGVYRSTRTGEPLTIGPDWNAFGNRTWAFEAGRASATNEHGLVEMYERVESVKPSTPQLEAYVGTYDSDEAETSMTVAIEKGALVLKRRPATVIPLTPAFADTFTAPEFGAVIFRRGGDGRVVAFSVVQERVWDLRFTRRP